MALVRIKDSNYYRDTETMALVNQDMASRDEYFLKRKLLVTQAQEINTVKSEINSIKADMQDIKNLMLQLVNKGTNG